MRSQIIGTGSYAPEKILTNRDLEEIVDTSDAWIVQRTGIRERRLAAEDQATSDLALLAARRALEMADLAPEAVELIIVGTVTPDTLFPSCAAILQAKLGNKKAFAFDVSAACAGSLYALAVADQFVAKGSVKNALVVGADILTRTLDWKDRSTCVLFGDGAGAMVLTGTSAPERGVLSTHLHTDGSRGDILCLPGGGSKLPLTHERLDQRLQYLKMNGHEVYKFAVKNLEASAREALAAHEFTPSDISVVIPHQANKRIVEAVLERLEIPISKCWMTIEKYGNSSAASLPFALDEANRAGWLRPGTLTLLFAVGAGMAWGSAIVRW